VVAGKIIDSSDYAFGYNAQTGNYGDLVKRGVIDPPKVVRTALQDAAPLRDYLSPPRLWSLRSRSQKPRRCLMALAGWVIWITSRFSLIRRPSKKIGRPSFSLGETRAQAIGQLFKPWLSRLDADSDFVFPIPARWQRVGWPATAARLRVALRTIESTRLFGH
jgi:hypothetical protein